jgi:DNA primase large subunit
VEQKQEPVAQKAVQKAAPKITLKVLAGVPVLLEARAFASAFSVEELCQNHLLREARGRINASFSGFVWPFGDPIKDLLSFHLAVILLSQIRDRRVWERFAEAEAKRTEDFMNATDDEVLKAIWTDLLIRAERCGPDEEERTGFPYRIHVTDFLRLAKGIDGTQWRLENRKFWKGWVYVTRRELVRLISEEVESRILRMIETVKVDRVPEPIKETAERIMLAVRFAKTDNKQTTQTPP